MTVENFVRIVWTVFAEIEKNGVFENFSFKGREKTRRERPKSAPYLRLKNIQGTTIGKKIFLKSIFGKYLFFKKSRTMPKNSKRGHSGSLNVFTNRKLQKNARGYPLIEFKNFLEKNRIVPKKTQRGDPLVSLYFWKHKKIVV